MSESRIKLTDTVMSAVIKMSEGNPGAIRVCAELIKEGGNIDPDSFMGGFGNVMDLDTIRIYGSRIWMLYKDVCGEDLRVMCAILRAWQLGFLRDTALNNAIDNMGKGIDVPALVAQVEERLPKFQKAQQTAA